MINRIFKNKYLLTSIQFFTFIIFILLIYGAWGISTTDPKFAKILRNTNLSNLIVWSYWWPLIVATAILFGRFWCSICPIELITSFFGRIGLKQKPNKFMKSGWFVTLFYAIILILGINTLAIHRIPHYMALYMLSLFAIAVLIGLLYEKRTFCSYVCPIGYLLGLYSLVSRRKLGVLSQKTCESCKTKDCISKNNHYKFIGRSCTSELYPAKIADGKDCILCGQCYKACPHDNILIQKQKVGAKLIQNLKLSWAEITFFMIVSGFVVYEILSNWSTSLDLLLILPNYINELFNIPSQYTGTVKALTLYVICPFIFYFAFAFIKKLISKESLKQSISQFVLSILPIAASMHLLKAILKTTSRLPYWDFALKDPNGVESAKIIMQNHDVLKNYAALPTFSLIINVLSILIPLLGLVLSFYVISKQNFSNQLSKGISILVVLIYSSIFLSTLIMWQLN
tara:strand:+ start:13408 stop:14775 length:1368 start_codon:yes stop_codon:yes gene_type:complete